MKSAFFLCGRAFFLPTYCKGKNNLNVKKKWLLSGWLLFLFLYVNFTNVLRLSFFSRLESLWFLSANKRHKRCCTAQWQQRSCCREQKRTRSNGAAPPREAEQQQQEHENKQKILFYYKGIMDAACDKPVKCDADLLALELQSSNCKWGSTEGGKKGKKRRKEERKKGRTEWVRTREEKGAHGGIGHRQYFRPNENRVSEKMLQKLFWCVS